MSVGSGGDSCDDALAEAFNALFKAEPVRHEGAWVGVNDVETATAEHLDWFNHRRGTRHDVRNHPPPDPALDT